MTQFIAGSVFAVLGKLGGKTMEGGFVPACHQTLDDLPGVQAKLFSAGDDVGIEQMAGRRKVHRGQVSFLSFGMASRIRRTISSGEIRSLCAEKFVMSR